MKSILGLIIALLVIAGGVYVFTKEDPMPEGDDSMVEGQGMTVPGGDSVGGSDMVVEDDGTITTGSYEEYSPEKVAREGDVVLFFHAGWCPTCRALDGDITKNDIPENLTILKVDFDTATELRQKYGVTVQHTLVHVDSEGNQIKKWSGGNRLSNIVDNL